MPGEQHSCEVPSSVAGFNICDRLGSGSFSVVYKGLSSASNSFGVRTTVAIKCISMQIANSSKLNSDCVVSEISILRSLKHRNIVRLLDFQWDKKYIYLIMEYCGGGDLAFFIRKYGSLPEVVARKLFGQLAGALQYMRAMNVAHMDLKPQNILLTNKSRLLIKVSDFGLSQYLKKNESTSSFRGSPLYMAPEIFSHKQYDSRVDLWSSGVILYECLYGRAPFCSDSYEALVTKILSSEPVSYPATTKLSPECLDLLQRLLVKDPQKRISFEKFFLHAFVSPSRAVSSQENATADELISQAENAEKEKKFVDALKLLTRGAQIYMSYLEATENPSEKTKLRQKIRLVLDHAESLKESLRPKTEGKSFSRVQSEWQDVPQVISSCLVNLTLFVSSVDAAILVADSARNLELSERWSEALSKYMLAIDGSLRVLEKEKNSSRAQKLQQQVSQWLSSAQNIKVSDGSEIDMLDAESLSGGRDDEAEKQFKKYVSGNHRHS
uniref:Serine/threonine-protein kinase ULK3 n=1 Tax=Syphacia muris TaxID=451379 RepID=A0A0N5ALA6_9BILA